jgi:hypothetical protein
MIMSDTEDQVSRRQLFHILGAATVTAGALGAQTHDHAAMANPAVSAPKGPYVRRVFDDHQWRTVQVLCALIIPADANSGSATDAGVPEFIDDWLDFRNHEDGNQNFSAGILGGLAWLDRESMTKFQVAFAESSADQQKQLLDRVAWPDKAADADRAWVEFFDKFRDLTVSGFVSSKTGIAYLPYLGNRAVAHWQGCDPKVWAILEDRMKNGYKGLGGDVAPFS